VCVRHRDHEQTGPSFKTVELIVEENPWKPRKSSVTERIVRLRLGREEARVREAVKSAGRRWNPQDRLWELRRDEALALGLEARIVEGGGR